MEEAAHMDKVLKMTEAAMIPANMTVEELCEEIAEKRRAKYSDPKRTEPYPRSNPIASDIGDCVRETVLGVSNYKDRPKFDPEVIARMERGQKIEQLMRAELFELGYTVREDRLLAELRDGKGQLLTRGRADGFIAKGRKEFAFEGKSMTPMVYNQINSQADFDHYVFFRKYPRQLQSYLLASNLEEGLWILDDCLGHWKIIPCRLDYDRGEAILKHLEGAVGHLAAGTLPDYHNDPAVCLKCWARGRVCNPPFFSGEGMKIIDNAELEQKLTRRAELDPMATEYDHLDKDLKEVLKEVMKKDQVFVIGKWMVKAEEKTKNFKAQPAKEASKTTYLGFDIEPIQESDEEKV